MDRTAKIDPSGATYKEFEQVTSFYRELLGRISAIPGTRYATLINSMYSSTTLSIDEHPPLPPEKEPDERQSWRGNRTWQAVITFRNSKAGGRPPAFSL
jgi:hypothetical protein